MPKKKRQKGAGQPPKYKRVFCKEIVDFFVVQEPFTRVLISEDYYKPTKGEEKPAVKSRRYQLVANPPPHVGQFSRKVGVTKRTLYNWAKKYPAFSEAMVVAKQIRREQIIDGGLMKAYDAKFTSLAARNYKEIDWREDVHHTVEGKLSVNEAWEQGEKERKKEKVKGAAAEKPE